MMAQLSARGSNPAIFGNTEADTTLSGYSLPSTRDPVQFRLLLDTRAPAQAAPGAFSQRELQEISQSMVDLSVGDFKVFENTDELFAYLDQD